jgi:hypothetical protein
MRKIFDGDDDGDDDGECSSLWRLDVDVLREQGRTSAGKLRLIATKFNKFI